MPTKREYAISLGLAKDGRGRLSREAHAAIEKAISEGMTFDDAPVVTRSTVKADKPVKPREKREPKTSPVDAGNVATISTRYEDSQLFVGTDSEGKKHTVNARQVCMPCGYSLTSHRCNDPVVLVPSMEYIHVTPKG